MVTRFVPKPDMGKAMLFNVQTLAFARTQRRGKTALTLWLTGDAESPGGRLPNWRMELIHFGIDEQETEALAVPMRQSPKHHGSNLSRALLI